MIKRGLNKKAISPLIATVLLIGATIALAALVMIWSQNLFTTTTERTGSQAETQIKCTSYVSFSITKSCIDSTTTAKITIDNNNEQPIEGFKAKVYDVDGAAIVTDAIASPNNLGAWSRKEYDIPISGSVDAIDMLPMIKLESGTTVTCGQRYVRAGSINSLTTDIPAC